MSNCNAAENIFYSPSSILNIYNNCISVKAEKKVLKIEGVYRINSPKEYGGYFYDYLQDINSNVYLNLMVPRDIKSQLTENYIYAFEGFITRKVKNSGNIQVNFCVTKFVNEKGNAKDEEINSVKSIVKVKSIQNYKNFKIHIENKLLNGFKPRLALIIGNNAIIEDDIFNMLGGCEEFYSINTIKINLSSKDEIINRVLYLDKAENYDAIVIARGGGIGIEIFNDIDIIDKFKDLNSILVTAIGHAQNYCNLESIADYVFDTPTAFGNYLKNAAQKISKMHEAFKEETKSFETQISRYQANEISYNEQLKTKDKNIQKLESKLKNSKRALIILFIMLLALYALQSIIY